MSLKQSNGSLEEQVDIASQVINEGSFQECSEASVMRINQIRTIFISGMSTDFHDNDTFPFFDYTFTDKEYGVEDFSNYKITKLIIERMVRVIGKIEKMGNMLTSEEISNLGKKLSDALFKSAEDGVGKTSYSKGEGDIFSGELKDIYNKMDSTIKDYLDLKMECSSVSMRIKA